MEACYCWWIPLARHSSSSRDEAAIRITSFHGISSAFTGSLVNTEPHKVGTVTLKKVSVSADLAEQGLFHPLQQPQQLGPLHDMPARAHA